MISNNHRFHGRTSLRLVFSKGRTSKGPYFSIKCVPNPRRRSYRLAVVVSRKVHKNAVIRNRLRRRLYETVRQMDRDINSPVDIAISVFNADLLAVSPSQIKALVKKQLSEVGATSH